LTSSQLFNETGGELYNCQISATNEVYIGDYQPDYVSLVSYNHNKTDGAFKMWNCGATTVDSTDVPPGFFGKSYKMTLSRGSYGNSGYAHIPFQVDVGETVTYRVYIKKNYASDINNSIPIIQMVDKFADPMENSAYTALDSVTMADSINTWENYKLSYTNTSSFKKQCYLRVWAISVNGIVYFYPVKINIKESWG
jgi:hypothetical protein